MLGKDTPSPNTPRHITSAPLSPPTHTHTHRQVTTTNTNISSSSYTHQPLQQYLVEKIISRKPKNQSVCITVKYSIFTEAVDWCVGNCRLIVFHNSLGSCQDVYRDGHHSWGCFKTENRQKDERIFCNGCINAGVFKRCKLVSVRLGKQNVFH